MRINSQAVALSAILLGIPAVAVAQTAPQHEWSHGTTINGFAGVASDPSRNGAVLGGAVRWELTPLFALEGTGAWFDRGDSVDAFAGALKALVTLVPGHRAMPFLQAGIGLYRASFERADGPMPEFYRRRLPAGMSPVKSRHYRSHFCVWRRRQRVLHEACRPSSGCRGDRASCAGAITTR